LKIEFPLAVAREGKCSLAERNVDNQCRKPSGWLGRRTLRNMNKRHSSVTDWGLSHLIVPRDGTILDIGGGGGRTIAKLAAASGSGVVHGVDHSPESVRVASEANAELVKAGRVAVRQGSVSQLPYASDTFDLVTAVETHFFWPDLRADVREVLRVVKPGGAFAIVAEVYKGADTTVTRLVEKYAPKTGMKLLTPDEHQSLLAGAGFADVQVFTNPEKGWVCAVGVKPL
jgi:ubiquinone/menaquinone biosynthesis C-methylase UbiE